MTSATSKSGQRRILAIAPSAYTLSGLATWLDYLLPGLAQRGWDVVLGLVEGPKYHRPSRYLDSHPFHTSVSIPCGSGTDWDRIESARRVIRHVGPDVVLTVNIPHALCAVAKERRNSGVETHAVMSCHGIQADLFSDMAQASKILDGVVCTSRLACRLSATRGRISSDRIFHGTCGAGIPNTLSARRDAAPFTIAYVGRLEQPQKRVYDVAKVADVLRSKSINFRVLLAGDGPEEMELRRHIREMKLDEVVEFLGHVRAAELGERVYQRSDALIVTSAWETGPLVVWEAMAHGCAIITSQYLGSWLEQVLVDRENCLMFEIGDVDQASQCVVELVSDRELTNGLRSNAKILVNERLSHESSISQWHAALVEIAGRACRRDSEALQLPSQCTGRLDRWVSQPTASRLRRAFFRKPPDAGPSGEWPHTLGGCTSDHDSFWENARRLEEGFQRHRREQHLETPAPC